MPQKKPHPKPPSSASDRKKAQYRYITPLVSAMNLNQIPHAKLAEWVGQAPFSIAQHFLQDDDRFRIPSLPELLKIHDAMRDRGLTPTGIHGRVYNYPEMFEGRPFTAYEYQLMADRRKLVEKVEALEKRLATYETKKK